MTRFTVATWNLHQGMDRRAANIAATRDFLETAVRPTVALLQEAVAPRPDDDQCRWERADGRLFGTAVVASAGRLESIPTFSSRHSKKHRFSISSTVPGAFVAQLVVDVPGVAPFITISAYGLMNPIYAQSSMLRMVADLVPLFDAPGLRDRIILGGDLNVYDQAKDRGTRERWLAILAAIESLGLVNLLKATRSDRERAMGCPCRDPECWHVETFRHRLRRETPGYLTTDYLFATPALAGRLISLAVWNDRDEVWDLSDHCPIVAEFEA
jgi:endonuclease/exonuclease/phosphatase family metal-dependent hydrolase